MPTLVERSVINLGQGSCVITLPKPWLRYFGIEPGDKLEVVTDHDLIIRVPSKREPKDEDERPSE